MTDTVFEPAYSLKAGVRKLVGTITGDRYKGEGTYGWSKEIGKKVFLLEEDALSEAERQRVKRLESLRRQVAKLEQLNHARPSK